MIVSPLPPPPPHPPPHFNTDCNNKCCNIATLYQNQIKMPVSLYISKVGDAAKSGAISNELMSRYGIYVQAINYPTVARGTERLRLAPTAHHKREMMDYFVESVATVWREAGLPMFEQTHPKACENCKRDLSLSRLYSAEPICKRSNCTYQSMQAALV